MGLRLFCELLKPKGNTVGFISKGQVMSDVMFDNDKVEKWNVYEKARNEAIAVYKKAIAEPESVRDKAVAKAKAVRDKLLADPNAVLGNIWAIYQKAIAEPNAVLDKAIAEARSVYDKAQSKSEAEANANAKIKAKVFKAKNDAKMFYISASDWSDITEDLNIFQVKPQGVAGIQKNTID